MNRWSGKVAFVTGASSGIGAAIAIELVKNGMQVVGIARRLHLLEGIQAKVSEEKGKFHPIQCDITKEAEILSAIEWTKMNLGGIDALINNAGMTQKTTLMDGNTKDWQSIFDTNVLALCITTREAIKSMRERNTKGHIIHVNSVGGHTFPITVGHLMSVYFSSKHAVTALAETLRLELAQTRNKIKVTSISPGLVQTEFLLVSGIANECSPLVNPGQIPMLEPKHIADAVVYVLSTPPEVDITELTIRPVGEIF